MSQREFLMLLIVGMIVASSGIFVAMYWWSEGVVDASEAFVLAAVFGGLIIGLSSAKTLPEFLLAFVPLAAAAAYGIYTWRVGSWRSYYKKRRGEFVAAIQRDPKNLAAREYLADVLYNLGDLDRAIGEIQAAVDLGAGTECEYRLGKWTKELHLRDTTNPVCRWCETENPQGARKCLRCGSDLPYDNAFARWLMGGRAAGARYYLLAVSGLAIVGVSLLLLPLKFAFIPILFCLITLGGWSLVSSARS